jgi:hypothetical protein
VRDDEARSSDAVEPVDAVDAVVESGPVEPISEPVDTARRRHGTAGAILAAGMFGVDIALGRKPKEEAPIVIDASGDPTNIDTDGIRIPLDEHTDVVAPPMAPSTPVVHTPKRRSR